MEDPKEDGFPIDNEDMVFDSLCEYDSLNGDGDVNIKGGESNGSQIEKYGFSSSELEAAIKIANIVTTDPAIYDSPEMRPFRKAWGKFMANKANELFAKSKFRVLELTKEQKRARKAREKAADLKLIESRRLRKARRMQLEALQATPKSALAAVPDGAVDDGVNTSFGNAGGADSVPLILADPGSAGILNDQDEDEPLLHRPRSCYSCKRRFFKLHHFYDQFCPVCADLNWNKRIQTTDLSRFVALLTGGRVKIGYQTALKLLRMGATVHVTTRFVTNAAIRFSKEQDFEVWKAKLHIHGLDFRDIGALKKFADYLLSSLPRLDIIINNACQTIRRPPLYYKHLVEEEKKFLLSLLDTSDRPPCAANLHNLIDPNNWHTKTKPVNFVEDTKENKAKLPNDDLTSKFPLVSIDPSKSSPDCDCLTITAASMTQLSAGDFSAEDTDETLFPAQLDVNGSQIDLRKKNSWLLKLDELSPAELVEVLAVNTVAPTILNSRLKPLLLRTKLSDEREGKLELGKYIINVSAMEGKFYRRKDVTHPHTNMAKAALNMMTRTSGEDYAKEGIFMNSVDTGWVNDENPVDRAKKTADVTNFVTPIDEIDAASRLLDPIISGCNGNERVYGKFLKDFVSCEW